MPTTFGNIITRAQGVIGEVAGPGVQVFAEDRMLSDAISAFNMVFIKYGWPEYTRWSRHELDGSTGKVTDDNLAVVRNFTDFMRVTRDGEKQPISLLPSSVSPYSLGHAGTRIRYYQSLPASDGGFVNKKLQFYPATAIGFVNIRARVYPVSGISHIVPDTVCMLDEDMLVFATAFFTLGFEDLNTGAADICRSLFEGRYRDILAALAGHATSLTDSGEMLTNWTQVP